MHWRSTTMRFAALVFLLQIGAAAALLLCVHVIVRGQVHGGTPPARMGGAVVDGADMIRLLEFAMPVAFSLAIAFAALAAWLAARMIVIRLDRAVATLGAVRDGDLTRRTPVEYDGDAFAMLAVAINGALDRIQQLVEELTLATDTLAHDLKSPLTRLRSALERAAMAADTLAAQDAVERAQAEGDRLLQTVEMALRITRAEAGIGRDAFTAVDPAGALVEIAEIYGPLIEDAGRTIGVAATTAPVLSLHRELIAQALGNLVDNALKYGAGTITLALTADPRWATISVSDEGPGIPHASRATALRRFGRIDEARSGSGAGLGLSLVAAVARLHGGEVMLSDAAGGGLCVAIRLPVRAD